MTFLVLFGFLPGNFFVVHINFGFPVGYSKEMARNCTVMKVRAQGSAGSAPVCHRRAGSVCSPYLDWQVYRCMVSCRRSLATRSPLPDLGLKLAINGSETGVKNVRRSFALKCEAQAATCEQAEDRQFVTNKGLQNCTLYDFLGLPRDASQEHIKAAYRRSVKQCHPDTARKDKMEKYTEEFLKVHDAYIVLSDPETRAQYDEELRLKSLRGRQISGRFPGIASFDQISQGDDVDYYFFRYRYRFAAPWKSNWETDQCW